MQDFKKLIIWQKAHILTLDVYKATKTYPKEELFWLISQTRRASTSVLANIAEGCGRKGAAEFSRFLQIALGSVIELECHLLLASDLEYIPVKRYDD